MKTSTTLASLTATVLLFTPIALFQLFSTAGSRGPVELVLSTILGTCAIYCAYGFLIFEFKKN